MSQQKVTKVTTQQIIHLWLQREHVFGAIQFITLKSPPIHHRTSDLYTTIKALMVEIGEYIHMRILCFRMVYRKVTCLCLL